MNPVAPGHAEQSLAQLAQEFDHWRRIRTSRAAPIPPPLWEQAVAVTALVPGARWQNAYGSVAESKKNAVPPSPLLALPRRPLRPWTLWISPPPPPGRCRLPPWRWNANALTGPACAFTTTSRPHPWRR